MQRLDPAAGRANRGHGRVELILTILLVVSAAGVAGALVKREFFSASPVASAVPKARFVNTWKRTIPVGQVMGDTTAPVQIVEFADLECPYCRDFHEVLLRTLAKHGTSANVVFVHFPLPQHRFAIPAARAAECASEQSRFKEFLTAVYRKQDSLGLKSWTGYATDAGVGDLARFERCATNSEIPRRIAAGRTLGEEFGISGTPTIIVNGYRFAYPPTEIQLDETIADILAGRRPKAPFGE